MVYQRLSRSTWTPPLQARELPPLKLYTAYEQATNQSHVTPIVLPRKSSALRANLAWCGRYYELERGVNHTNCELLVTRRSSNAPVRLSDLLRTLRRGVRQVLASTGRRHWFVPILPYVQSTKRETVSIQQQPNKDAEYRAPQFECT